jgi:ribosome-binding factor A
MSSKRIDRVNELLQREIAQCLYRVQFDEPLDLARVTIARVICAPDLRKARVLVSVLSDEHGEPDPVSVTRTLNRNRKDIQQLMASHVVLKYTPHLHFVIDDSLVQADRVLDILDHLPPPADED